MLSSDRHTGVTLGANEKAPGGNPGLFSSSNYR